MITMTTLTVAMATLAVTIATQHGEIIRLIQFWERITDDTSWHIKLE